MRTVFSTKVVRHARRDRYGFTLIEVLVVVAIIALLVAILIPSLKKAREQSKKTVCASGQHQIGLAMVAYSLDHKDVLPYRGWFPYTIAEAMHESLGKGGKEKVLCNLGLLHGWENTRRSWCRDWNVIYCPNRYDVRDCPSGIKSIAIPENEPGGCRFNHGGYDYVVPISQRGSSPSLGSKNVYPRDAMSKGYWVVLQMKQGLAPEGTTADQWEDFPAPRIPQGVKALVSDWIIGMDPKKCHGNGVNVLYSDGHAKFFQLVVLPCLGRNCADGTTQYDTWYYYNIHQ